jgi:hypothetical protein
MAERVERPLKRRDCVKIAVSGICALAASGVGSRSVAQDVPASKRED